MGIKLVAAQSAPIKIAPVAPQRRLSAVMLADVVNYSRMMSRSEEETHARVTKQVRELIEPTIEKYSGHLVRSMGDGLLVEFTSAVDAVRCALDIQRGLATSQVNEKDRILLRIGINTGDVLVDRRDIYGNSVNIAARLEALARPGTICVSQSIYDQTRAHAEFFFANCGTHRLKNIPYPIHVYEIASEPIRVPLLTRLAAYKFELKAALCIAAIVFASIAFVFMFRERHGEVMRTNRIVVLPFKNMNGDTADDYLADAITDDLTTELSRLQRAWVIASRTAFTYRDKPNDPRQIGRELRVRYALEGSVRRAGPNVQVSAQLIDIESGTNLWANSFDYETSSLLDLQDELMGRIANSLNDQVTRAGARGEVGTLAADHNPLDERMRAMAASAGYPTPQKFLETRQHAEAGLKADPDNARLLGLLASVLVGDVLNGWNDAGRPEVDRAEAAAKKAIGLDYNTPIAHHALGYVHRLHGNHKAALDAFNTATKIDPNFARSYAQAGNEMVFLGNPGEASALVAKAIELSPNDAAIATFLWVQGRAYFTLGDYPKAIKALEDSVRARPNLWYVQAWLTAAYALSDRDVDARKALKEFQEKYQTRSSLDAIAQYYSEKQYQNPTLKDASDRLLKGLRKAGLK
ncbi:adenylate/guanylate cyclase domain-containing protein [Bradyrhizobium sp.]|uniref:adenylate/guanylate cyclase domain-containing protein n=1 Tax=Bradyrhizobium sp. TaxID=376 RepID=UPI00262ED5D0|nr:adenylate/guanylate cyclase domain-containing protein [Bradyrhizobium sp.]